MIISLLLTIASFGNAVAQSPSELSKSYFEVLKKGEYGKVAGFFAPSALKEFREFLDFGKSLPAEASTFFYSTFFGASASRESVGKMSDVEFFGAFLSSMMKQIDYSGGVGFDKVEVLGEVPEGEKVVHVLTRNHVSAGEIKMEKMEVVSFENVDGKWMVLLSGQIKGMAAQLKKNFEKQGK